MPLVKVADNWDALSDAEKIALFEAAGYEQPEIEDLRALGKFRVVAYSKENEQVTCNLVATPKVQIVLPKDLLNIKQVEDINKITITQNKVKLQRINKRALLHFNNSYKDEYGTVWSANTANVAISSDGKFGSCLEFNGSGDQLLADNDIHLGTGEFTIDFWAKVPNTQPTSYPTLIADRNNTFRIAKDNFIANGTISEPGVFSDVFDDTWHHVALVRKNDKYIIFIDGVKKKETTNQINANINVSTIGASNGAYSITYIKGKIDEFSVVPYAKWTDNFTPPTAPYDNPPEVKPNDIRFAFTIDKNKYYTYKNNAWEEIQSNEIPTKGIIKEVVEAIPTEKWHELITAKDTKIVSKLGIAYSIQQRYVDDTCNIDNLSLTISQKGKWRQVRPMDYYLADFVDNETLDVTLNNAGSYKINYALGE